MQYVRPFALVLVSTLAACGGGDDGDSGGGVIVLDGGSGSTQDSGGSGACTLGTVGAATPMATEAYYQTEEGETSPGRYYLFADLTQDAAPDVLYVDLFAGYTAFTDGITPKTISLADTAEQTYDSCGGCVIVQTDYSDAGATDEYMPTGGTLDITAASTTSIAGTLTNATFRHVTIAEDGTTTDVSDGCVGSVASVSFSATPEADTALTGTKRRWRASLHTKAM